MYLEFYDKKKYIFRFFIFSKFVEQKIQPIANYGQTSLYYCTDSVSTVMLLGLGTNIV